MDYGTILYDPIYAAFGMPATLTPNRAEAAPTAVTIIERTTGTDVSEEFDLNAVRVGAFVRRHDLDQAGIALADLDGGMIVFGGGSWRIERHAPRPGPDGEASGEILMHLADA